MAIGNKGMVDSCTNSIDVDEYLVKANTLVHVGTLLALPA